MRKRITAIVLVLSTILSFMSFADIPGTNEAIPQIYVYDFYFRDSSSNILKTNTAGDITAEVYAGIADDEISKLDVSLSILVYYKNKVISAEKTDVTITETAVKITTPKVTIDNEIANDVTVKAMLTDTDFSMLLAPVATLGSSLSNVEKITVGEYEIFTKDDVYEYSITRYFTNEEITPPLRAYASDLSTKAEISSVDENGVIIYTLKTTSCDGSSSAEYKINVTPIIAEETSLAGIEVNGKTIEDFTPAKTEYILSVEDNTVPVVTAYNFNKNAEVIVDSATTVPGTTTVKVSYNNNSTTYKINFVKPQVVTLEADTSNASYKYAYQYRESESKVSAGLLDYLRLKTPDKMFATATSRVGYAAFDTTSLKDFDIIYPINIKASGKWNYKKTVEVYNSTFTDSTGIKDQFAEILDGSAKLLGTFSAEQTESTLPVNKGDIKICDNGNIVLVFAKQYDSATATDEIAAYAKLEITYLPKNLSVLTEKGFDETLIAKPQQSEIVKGDATVTASSEWNDLNGFTLLNIDLDAEFPDACNNKNVLVKVLKPGINESDSKPLTDKYAYIYNTETDSKGIINESFNLSCDAGTYTFVLSCNGYEKSITTTLTMPSADKMNELLDGLKLQSYDNDTLNTYLSSNIEGLSLTNSLYAAFSDETRKLVSQYVIDNILEYSASGFSNTLNEGSILLGINKNETDQTVLKVLETDEISELIESNENFEDYKNGGKNEILPLLKNGTYKTYNDISNAVYENLFIIQLKKSSNTDDVTNVINAYRNYMSYECYFKYKGIGIEDKEIINAKILEKLAEIDSISKIEEIILSNLPELIAMTEPSRTIHTYGFVFKNQDGTEIKKIDNSSKIKAEVYAEISDASGSNINAKFVVMTYSGDKLLKATVKPYTLTKDAVLISSDYVNIDAEVTDVKAIIISEDEKDMLSTVGILGSDNAEIADIYIGNYKIPLNKEQSEYTLTRFFDENEAVKLRAYAKDFSAKIEIKEKKENGIITYTVTSDSSDGVNSEEYKINLKAYDVNSTSLAGIEIDGKELSGFYPNVYEYYVGLKGSIIPDVTAYKFSSTADVSVVNATSIPGTTVINVTNGEKSQTYKIHFVKILSTTVSYSDYRTMSGNHTYKSKFQVRASTEPLDGGSNIVLYYQFDVKSLGDISIVSAEITGNTITENKLYFYNSSYSDMSEVESAEAMNFAEINNSLVSYLGEKKFAKGETASVVLDRKNLDIKDNGSIVILTRKKYGDINSTDYGEFQNGKLKFEYIVKPSADTLISETSDKKFDINVLDKGEITYLSGKEGTLALDTTWTGETPKLNLSVDASYSEASKNQNVLIKILRPDTDETTDKAFAEKYIYTGTYPLDENGNLKTSVIVDEVPGEYKIVLKCENTEKTISGTFTMPQQDKIITLLNNLKGKVYTKDTLYTYLIDNKAELSLNNSALNLLNTESGKSVCDYIINNLSVYTADAFSDILSEALAVKGINSLESNGNVQKLLEEESIYPILSADKNYGDYVSLSDKTTLLNSVKTQKFNTLNDVKEAFFENLLILKLSGTTSYLLIEDVIDSYSAYITPSVYSRYDSLTYDERMAVNVKIAQNISLMTDISVLETKIGEFIDNPNGVPPVVTDPPVQTGGGGGGSIGNVATEVPEITPPKTMNFTDVTKDFWGYSYIENLFNKNIISGRTQTEFFPYDNVTRAEFTKMLVTAMNISGNMAELNFTDVSSDAWYYGYVNTAVANGIIQGMSENSFAPEKNISRQDASVMINRILKLENTKEDLFGDDSSISDYAKSAVYALKENNIIKGYDGNFNPLSNLTRAEAAVLINNMINH